LWQSTTVPKFINIHQGINFLQKLPLSDSVVFSLKIRPLALVQYWHIYISKSWRARNAIFTARRNARLLALQALYQLRQFSLSVCPSVHPSHAGIASKRRHIARCSWHCRIAKCV